MTFMRAQRKACVNVVGGDMVLRMDDRPVGHLGPEGVDHPTKDMVGFTIAWPWIPIGSGRSLEAGQGRVQT